MDFAIRPAQVADIPHLANALLEAAGGLIEAVYEGTIPGRSTEVIVEHLFSRPGAKTSFENAWVAEAGGEVLGAAHAFPVGPGGDSTPDPLARAERLYLYEPFQHLRADGSYFLMAVAVHRAHRGTGIGTRLIAEAEAAARAQGFAEMSLTVFAQNARAVRLYERLGYEERARRPIVPHEKIRFGGDLLLMVRTL